MINEIRYYEGSCLFYSIKTSNNIKDINKHILNTLKHQFKYRPTNEDLWASVFQDNVEITRYVLQNKKGTPLLQVIFSKNKYNEAISI
jgi:hypothetical protein